MKTFFSAMPGSTVVCGLLLALWTLPVLAADPPQQASKKDSTESKTVQLIVDYGDGVKKHFHRIKWQDKMTVQAVTLAAAKHPRGIQVKQRGKKATAFLSQIDDLANSARGRSWVYRVNGKLADRSFGVYAVSSGDVITWSYQEYP